jgi:hypothetical protein
VSKRFNLSTKFAIGGVTTLVLVLAILGYTQLTKKSPQQIEFEQQVEDVSLEGKVEDFEIEGSNHVSPGINVEYKTNPPTSGSHLSQGQNWGVYNKEINDKAAVHGLEHGGIWITYKDVNEETKEELESIGKANSQSVIVSPRSSNDNKIVVASWGRMMKLDSIDKVLIQKYIDVYKNQSPEKLAQ